MGQSCFWAGTAQPTPYWTVPKPQCKISRCQQGERLMRAGGAENCVGTRTTGEEGDPLASAKLEPEKECPLTPVSLCKVLLMVIGLICALHTATVEGGRALAAAAVGGTGVDLPPTAPSYSSKCRYPYKCPPAGSP
uniref:Uncharacterized protein n=1 Tax=Oryza sativa subsp. japonica TaxID=39947 RepID=Q8S7P2_ORYSJ|nr:hypothetical protein [Oryza sativa Japonica Group]